MSSPTLATSPTRTPADAVPTRARPRIGAMVWTALFAIGCVFVAYLVVTIPAFRWDIVAKFLFSTQIMTGLLNTIVLTVVSMLIGVVLGTVLAVMRGVRTRAVSAAAGLYIWFFRGTPVLVQLIFWFNLASLLPRLSLGIPFTDTVFASVDTNTVISPYTAALLGLGLNQAAYTAEIVRAGILSVPRGQLDAASSLGMTRLLTMRRVVLPQAMRVIIPPIGNETIGMLKATSMVSVLAMPDLLFSAQVIYAKNYQIIPLLIAASIWYLLLTSILTLIQGRIERRFSPHEQVQQTGLERIRGFVDRARRFHHTDAAPNGPIEEREDHR
jgi:polar amino acid transport system permease protein